MYSESEIPRRRFGFNSRENFTVSLLSRPNDASLLVSNLSSITIWCAPFNAFFGRLDNIPAALTTSLAVSYELHNCGVLYCYDIVLLLAWLTNVILYSTS